MVPSSTPRIPGPGAPGAATAAAALDGASPAAPLDLDLEAAGFVVWRQLVPPDAIERALRVLNLEIVRRGLTPEEIGHGSHSTFFPHLRWEDDILALRSPVEDLLLPQPEEQWADSQLLLRFPDEAAEWPLAPHVDDLPPWADGRSYRAIVGVPLSPSAASNGCLVVWPGSHRSGGGSPTPVELDPGDVVVMHPALQHSGTLNRGGSVRYTVYFRLLGAPPADAPAP